MGNEGHEMNPGDQEVETIRSTRQRHAVMAFRVGVQDRRDVLPCIQYSLSADDGAGDRRSA